uniref:PBPe domain-containing protein n=1 Tax=Heligmosomoides polygyrus TaxID=6339 RepID=A0A183GS14_HELPZ
LFADSTKEPRLRVSAMKYSQISILLSVNIIAITEKLSHSLERFWAFQLITVFVAFIALFCFMVAGSLRPTLPHSVERGSLLSDVDDEPTPPKGKEVGSMWVAMQEICFERDFVAIIATNFIHIASYLFPMGCGVVEEESLLDALRLNKFEPQVHLFYFVYHDLGVHRSAFRKQLPVYRSMGVDPKALKVLLAMNISPNEDR